MKIIILGAGQVGSSLAQHLASEANDITVVDSHAEVLHDLQNRLDLRTVGGHASRPDVLERAGIEDADMIVAVTNSDEVNMVACQVAYTLFHTPKKIARVRTSAYLRYAALYSENALPIDVVISPEDLVKEYIHRLIRHPGALQVVNFANARLQLVAVKVQERAALEGARLADLPQLLTGLDIRIAAIFRRDMAISLEGETRILAEDEVFFLAAPEHVQKVIQQLREVDRPYKRITIAGGGNIGKRLADALEDEHQVKVIERDTARARYLAQALSNTIVFEGDAADEELLRNENIDSADIFVAVTNDDEANILSAMLAKQLGARKVMSLVTKPSYTRLVEGGGIVDIAISPQQVTLGGLMKHVRRGDVVAVQPLHRGTAEVMETIAHGNANTSRVVGRRVAQIKLPQGVWVSAIVRGDEIIMAHRDTVIEPEDHVIILVANRRRIPEVERLFQVRVTFL